MKSSGIGGMATIEGVMMKNKEQYAIAVRKPDNEIIVDKKTYKSFSDKVKIFRYPILRGIAAFIDSMIIGITVMDYAASFYDDSSEEKKVKSNKSVSSDKKDSKYNGLLMALTVIASLSLAIGLFTLTPFFISTLLSKLIGSKAWLSVIEGVIRLVIFVLYVVAISQIKDIKRVFMYHGAEHKAINCIENGFELTVKNVKWQSKEHKRCGTSFMLYVMVISIIFFMFITVDQAWLRVVIRILLVPIIAGVSYEFIRIAGNSDSTIINILSKPGLLLQRLTTKEPDDKMIEVAIKSVEAVFDWQEYLEGSTKKSNSKKKNSKKNLKKSISNTETLENKKGDIEISEKEAIIEEDISENNKAERINNNIKQKDKKQVLKVEKQIEEENIKSESSEDEFEEDDILKALDKFLDLDDD